MTADNVYRNLEVTIHSQNCTVLNKSNLQSQGHFSAVIHNYLFLSNRFTSLSLNPIIVLVVLHGKLFCALLAKRSALPVNKYSYGDIRWTSFAIVKFHYLLSRVV
jgi:hypothetical protein